MALNFQQSRNGSCTSPTSTAGLSRGSRAGLEGSSGVPSRSGNYGGDQSSGGGVSGGPSSGAGSGGGGSGVGPTGRTRPECVRRSKSQGTGSHHRYRDRLVRTLAFNSSCPANAKEEEASAASSSSGAPPHFHSGSESVDHYCGHNNGKLLDHGRDEPALQHTAARRNLLLLHHRHQSAYTSFGTNVTWHTHQTTLEQSLYFSIQSTFTLTNNNFSYWFIFYSFSIRPDFISTFQKRNITHTHTHYNFVFIIRKR